MSSRYRTRVLASTLGAWLLVAQSATGESADHEEAIGSNDLLRLCAALHAEKPDDRWAAAQEILGLGKENLDVISRRLASQYTAKPENMRLVLTGLRKKLKDATIADLQARGKRVNLKDLPLDDPPSFLEKLVRRVDPNYPDGWRDAVEIMVLLNALIAMGTTESIGTVVDHAPRNEAAFRKEIYQLVIWAGPKAVPALVRRQNSKDPDVALVVSTALADMKMERPGQQVQVKDHRILIEVLTAFGEHKNIEALDTVAAFMNSDMDQVREAAREAMKSYGKLGLWTMKKEYKEYVGEMPPAEWEADRIAEELFSRQDADRMAPLDEKMQEGLSLAAAGDFEKMEKVYQEILARQPFFGRRAEMVSGYLAYGAKLTSTGDIDRATLMYKVAQRLDVTGTHERHITARLYLLEGLLAIEQGAPDAHPLRQAIEIDPDLEMARDRLAEVERLSHRHRIGRLRILGAAGIGMAALMVLALLAIRKLR